MPELLLKLVLVGNTAVGKTCIVKRAADDIFADDTSPTLGASYLSKIVVIRETTVRVQIWDTAGQERYRGMTPMYFRGAHVAIVAYSVTDLDSFEAIDSWIVSLRDNGGPNVVIFVVGNKCDNEEGRVVETARGEGKATNLKAEFYEVSAKTGDGIEDLFMDICKVYIERTNPLSVPRGLQEIDDKELPAKKQQCCA
jgi:small GTP-binding protein